MAKLWLEWNSTTTQEARNKANDDLNYVETCRIFAKTVRKWGAIRGELAKLWLEWNYDNNTASTKTGTQSTTGTKNMRTVLKCLFTMARTCWNVARGAWLFNVGITSCRRIKLRHFNNARPFWNKSFIQSMVWRLPTYSNDDILSTTIHQEPTQYCFFCFCILWHFTKCDVSVHCTFCDR